jgi:hypothetical protein
MLTNTVYYNRFLPHLFQLNIHCYPTFHRSITYAQYANLYRINCKDNDYM